MLVLPSLVALAAVVSVRGQTTYDAAALAASLNLANPFHYAFPPVSSLDQYSDTSLRAKSSYTRGNNATVKFMRDNWNLNKGNVQFGRQDLGFVAHPAGDTSASSVNDTLIFAVEYPAGSYSHATGGAQFYSGYPNTTNASTVAPLSLLLTYSVYFPANFDFVHGGKLAGLRGGIVDGCAGGEKTNGSTCFSSRLMWRDNGAGEVYAYLPEINGLCSQSNVICDPGYGISLGRGQFTFKTGMWNDMALYIQLNQPSSAANGIIQLYHNGNKSIEFTNLAIRTTDAIASVGGLMFSTFFGGSDTSWATPNTQYTYYRDMAMYAGGAGGGGNSSAGVSGSSGGSSSSSKGGATSAGSTSMAWDTGRVFLAIVALTLTVLC